MRRLCIILAGALAPFLACPCAMPAASKPPGAESRREIRVAVLPFKTKAAPGNPLLTEAYAQKMGDCMTELMAEMPQIMLVEREGGNRLPPETDLDGANSESMATMAAVLNADYVVQGSINNLSVSQRTFNQGGLQAVQEICKAAFGVKMINVSTGKVFFAGSENGIKKITQTAGVRRTLTEADFEELSRETLKKLAAKLAAGMARIADEPIAERPKTVLVKFTAEPKGADVLLDGLYIGPAPGEHKLPAGYHALAIRYQGHIVWNNRVEIREGMQVNADLRDLLLDARDVKDIQMELAKHPPTIIIK